jgi:hypothetical protein
MNVGDLVRRKKVPVALRQDPRVGIVQSTFPSHPDGQLVCTVQWHDETTGHYFDTCLEALCK